MSLGFQFGNELGHNVLVQRSRVIQPSNDLIAADGDRVGSCVGDGEIADPVVIEFDQCGSPLQMPESSGHECGRMTCVFGRDGGHGERTNGSLSGGHQLILVVRNGEDLLSFGIVGHAQVMNQVDAKDVIV